MNSHGTISHLNEEKRFGFIVSEGKTYFFHFSSIIEFKKSLSLGSKVVFEDAADGESSKKGKSPVATNIEIVDTERKLRKTIGPYLGATLSVSDEVRARALTEMSRWKLEAKLEDVKRYFFIIPQLNNILAGQSSYVIGRKGTGKTALVQYLSETSKQSNYLVSKLSFKNFPFNELYTQSNDSFSRPNQYISIWKLIIYSAVCRLLGESRGIDPLVKRKIDKAFPPVDSDNLGTIVGKWIAGNFGISILGTGLNFGGLLKEKAPITLQQKVENLESFVVKNASSQKLFVLFDELDEDYKDMLTSSENRAEYIDLVTSLFKAVQDIRATSIGRKLNIFPVIFLRDDIYDLIQDPDKNKWRDLQVNLDWNANNIRDLLAYRLSRVLDSESSEFSEIWYTIFDRNPVVYSGGKKEIESFNYIRISTQGRPRDYINYLKECAQIELGRSSKIISEESIKDADKVYSNYLKAELIDEIHGIIPDISSVLSIFSEARKWILSIKEFKDEYNNRVKRGILKIKDSEMILRTLFYFSVIGNVVRPDLHVFRHERPDAQLNFRENIVVHRGLMKSLQIL